MFVKKDIEVKRSTTINAPLTQVQEQIIFFKNFVKWRPWAEMDPNSKTEFSGEDGKVGAKYSWSGNEEVGTGHQEILSISDTKVKLKLVFTAPWESESDVYYNFSEENGQTTVTWGYKGEMPIMASFFVDMDEMLGSQYEKGLSSLKSICEK